MQVPARPVASQTTTNHQKTRRLTRNPTPLLHMLSLEMLVLLGSALLACVLVLTRSYEHLSGILRVQKVEARAAPMEGNS